MRNRSESTPDTLTQIQRRSKGVSSEFELSQTKLRNQLQTAMLQAKNGISTTSDDSDMKEATPFGSAWLPGPLSYPWLLMFAGVPTVIEQLLRQV